VLSKGHAAPALYCALSAHGFITKEQLGTFAQPGSPLEEHPNHLIPGVSTPSGSLGHGLPFAAGYVLAGAKDGNLRKAVVVMSDGECNEGTVWESAIFAGARGLEGITVVVDANQWQATGRTSESFGSIAIADMFRAAQWSVKEIDGHSEEAIRGALSRSAEDSNKPLCIVAKTVKGKGVSFMEDDNNWHYRTLSEAEHALASKDLAGTN
jgi:transketolase